MSYPTRKPTGRSAGRSRPSIAKDHSGERRRWPEESIPTNSSPNVIPETFAPMDSGSPRGGIQDMIALKGGVQEGIQGMIDTNPVLVMATSTCPFCVEAVRALAGHGITGQIVYLDKEPNTAVVRKAMAAIAGKTSVPQIWINKKHIGGCDDLKALDVTGDLGPALEGIPRTTNVSDAESAPNVEKSSGSAAISTFPGPTAAYFATFHAPISVDNRAVRLGGSLTSIFALACIVFAERYVTHWVVFGMFVSKALDMTGFPGPYSSVVKLPFAGTKPRLQSGPARQFANVCGFMFSGIAWACLVGGKPLGAQVMMGILGIAAFCQGAFNFCAGCFVFGYMLKYNFVSSAIYRLHVNTRADTLHTWEHANVRTGKEIAPEPITYPTKDLPPNPTDLRARPYDSLDKWQQFHFIKYCHVELFMMPLSILGLAFPWAKLSETVGTSPLVWQTLAWTGVSVQAIIGALYLAKCALYPNKVKKEWCHPIGHNMFAPPFISIILMSFLATKWSGVDFSGDLARVLFWMGSAPLNAIALYTVASWVSIRRDQEFINPTWMLMPVGNLVGALVARPVDEDYVEWGWYLFGVGCLLWLALWPITFLNSIDNHHSDPRNRNFYGVWVAPPAVALLAYASLKALGTIDDLQRVLFYASLSMSLVLGACAWPLNFFLEAKFAVSLFAFSFPLDVLAAAAVTMYGYTQTHIMKVIYVAAVTIASMVNAVNVLQLLGALAGRHVFTPKKKCSPLAFTKMTHEAFREALPRLEKLATQVKPGAAGATKLRELASAWRAVSMAHDVHSRHEDEVIFPALETYFPGQTSGPGDDHKEHEALIHSVQSAMDSLLGNKNASASADTILDGLKANLRKFGKEVREHMDNEERFYSTPVTRKYLNVTIAKDLARRSWDVTPNKDMSDFLGWVLSSLRIRRQRAKFLKTWTWAMPERAQLVGLMVYRVVDDVTWVQLARDLPEIVPRGLPGYMRYY